MRQYGAMPRVHVELTFNPLHSAAVTGLVQDDRCGGVVVFLGDVRSVTHEKSTSHLEYEAHEAMALKKMRELAEGCAAEFEANVAVVHRLGKLMPGETSVVCAAACAHRAQAFECCRQLIDRLKQDVPIWKKEFGPDGVEWPANAPA